MIGRDTHVRGALLEELCHRSEHAPDRPDVLARRGLVVGQREVVAEEFVGPIDQVHTHLAESATRGDAARGAAAKPHGSSDSISR